MTEPDTANRPSDRPVSRRASPQSVHVSNERAPRRAPARNTLTGQQVRTELHLPMNSMVPGGRKIIEKVLIVLVINSLIPCYQVCLVMDMLMCRC